MTRHKMRNKLLDIDSLAPLKQDAIRNKFQNPH